MYATLPFKYALYMANDHQFAVLQEPCMHPRHQWGRHTPPRRRQSTAAPAKKWRDQGHLAARRLERLAPRRQMPPHHLRPYRSGPAGRRGAGGIATLFPGPIGAALFPLILQSFGPCLATRSHQPSCASRLRGSVLPPWSWLPSSLFRSPPSRTSFFSVLPTLPFRSPLLPDDTPWVKCGPPFGPWPAPPPPPTRRPRRHHRRHRPPGHPHPPRRRRRP